MATGADVRDILELTGGENDGPITKKDLINSDKVGHKISIVMYDPVFQNSNFLIFFFIKSNNFIWEYLALCISKAHLQLRTVFWCHK